MSGDYFELPMYSNVLPIYVKHDKKARSKLIETKILPSLYLTYVNDEVKLNFDDRCGKEFI